MLVKLKDRYAGPRGNFGAGEVIDLPDFEANNLVFWGYARHVVNGVEVKDLITETATSGPMRKNGEVATEPERTPAPRNDNDPVRAVATDGKKRPSSQRHGDGKGKGR